MTFKKRYLLVLLPIFWLLFAHSNVMTMRTSNEQQRVIFEEKGINDFSFQNYSVDRTGFGYSDFGNAEPSLQSQALQLKPILEKYADRNQTNKTLNTNVTSPSPPSKGEFSNFYF